MVTVIWGTQAARADIGPPIKVRLPRAETFPAMSLQPYHGVVEVLVGGDGTLDGFSMTGAGWTILSIRPAGPLAVRVGDTVRVEYDAIPQDGNLPLRFSVSFNDLPIRKTFNLSPARFARIGKPGRVVSVDAQGRAAPFHPVVGGGRSTTSAGQALHFFGRIVYQRPTSPSDGTLITVGADGIWFEVMDDDGPDLLDETIYSGYTDPFGYFDVNVTWSDCDITGCDNPDIYLRWETDNGVVNVQRSDLLEEDYSWSTQDHTIDDFTGSEVDFGTVMPADPGQYPAIHIHNSIMRAYRYILLNSGTGIAVKELDVQWPEDEGGSGAFYTPAFEEIHIAPSRQWNEGTHTHEYGHHFMFNYSAFSDPDYANGICDTDSPGHCQWCQETDHDAWNEGWPNWLGDVVTRFYPLGYDGYQPYTGRSQEDIQTTCSCCIDGWPCCAEDNQPNDPFRTEGYAGALCRDIEDATQDDHDGVIDCETDALSLGPTQIFQVVTIDKPSTIVGFINAFRGRFPQYDPELWSTVRNVSLQFSFPRPSFIVRHPVGQTVGRCQGATFSVEARGQGAISYRWRHDGVNISDGANYGGTATRELTIKGMVPSLAGAYEVVVSSLCGFDTSNPAVLTFDDNPQRAVLRSNGGTGPGPRTGHAMVYDSRRKVVVLYGGSDIAGRIVDETWEWNGRVWTPGPHGPPPLAHPSLAYDSDRNVTVLFGGMLPPPSPGADNPFTNETWEYDGAWTLRKPRDPQGAPPICYGANMTYDRHLHRTVMIGGANRGPYGPYADTWVWDGTSWFNLIPVPPNTTTGIYFGQLIYDPDRVKEWLIAGGSTGDVLQWQYAAWSFYHLYQGGEFYGYGRAAAYDPFRHGIFYYGGGRFWAPVNRFWFFDGSVWSDLGVFGQPVTLSGMSYDTNRAVGVIHGGFGSTSPSGETWEIPLYGPGVAGTLAPQIVCPGESARFEFDVVPRDIPVEKQWYRNGIPVQGQNQSALSLPWVSANDAGTYTLVASACETTATSIPAVLNVLSEDPTITAYPNDAKVCLGEDVTMTIGATGRETLSYQWYKNQVDIDGATGPSLTIRGATFDDSGDYGVVVSGCGGLVDWNPIRVTVESDPEIIDPPQGQVVCPNNEGVRLSVNARGVGAIAYQWRRNGADLPGETQPNLNLNSFGPLEQGSYDVVLTDDCGTDFSDAAELTLYSGSLAIPNNQPFDQVTCIGGEAVLRTDVPAGPGTVFSWCKFVGEYCHFIGGADPKYPGASTSTLTIHDIGPADAVRYQLYVNDQCVRINSREAVVVVVAACSPSDFNHDGHIDAADLVQFEACGQDSGPGIPYDPAALPPGCLQIPDGQGLIPADLDGDGDVDEEDFARFQRCFSGPDDPADPACANP